MKISAFRPDIDMTVLNRDAGIFFGSKLTGSYSLFSAADHKLVTSFTNQSLDGNPNAIAITHAIDFEKSLLPIGNPPFPQKLLNSDYHDTTRNSHTTGGGRRSYLSVAFQRALSTDPNVKIDGINALLSWARDQGQRPVCWLPFKFNYDAYYGVIGPDHKNPIWKYDMQDKDGWNIFDPAHLESASLFSGAALGFDECMHHFAMLLSWVVSTFPGKSNFSNKPLQGWHGSRQPRAIGWMIWFLTRACYLGFDTADDEFTEKFFCGYSPKEHLLAYIHDLLTMNLPIGADVADDRTMVVIGTKNGISQIRGALTFQEAILFASLGYLLKSQILNPPLRDSVRWWLNDRIATVLPIAVTDLGMSYSFSRDYDFTKDDVDLANSLEKDPGHYYELVPPKMYIRDLPRVADCELMVGALTLALSNREPAAINLAKLLPSPSDAAYKNMATYMDTFYA